MTRAYFTGTSVKPLTPLFPVDLENRLYRTSDKNSVYGFAGLNCVKASRRSVGILSVPNTDQAFWGDVEGKQGEREKEKARQKGGESMGRWQQGALVWDWVAVRAEGEVRLGSDGATLL